MIETDQRPQIDELLNNKPEISGPSFDVRLDNWISERETDKEGKKNRQNIVKAIRSDQARGANMRHLSGSEVLSKAVSSNVNKLFENPKTQLQLPDGFKVISSVDIEDPIEKETTKWGDSQNKKYTLELLIGPSGEMIARKVTIIKGSQSNPSGRIIHEQAVIGRDGKTSLTIKPESSRFFQYDPNKKQEVLVGKEAIATDDNGLEKEENVGKIKFKNNDGNEEIYDIKKPVLTTEIKPVTVGSLVNIANPDISDRTDLQEAAALLFRQISEKIFKETQTLTKREIVQGGLKEANQIIGRQITNLVENKPNTFYSRDFLKMIQQPSSLEKCLEGSRFEGSSFQEWFDEMAFITQVMKRKGKTLQIQGGNGFLLRSLQEWSGSADSSIPYVVDADEKYIAKAREMFPGDNPQNFSNAPLAEVLENPKDFDLSSEYENILWVPESIIHFDSVSDINQIKALFDRLSISGRVVIAFPEYPKDRSLEGLDESEKILKLARMDAFDNLKAYLNTTAAHDKGLSLSGILENDRSDEGILLFIDNKEK